MRSPVGAFARGLVGIASLGAFLQCGKNAAAIGPGDPGPDATSHDPEPDAGTSADVGPDAALDMMNEETTVETGMEGGDAEAGDAREAGDAGMGEAGLPPCDGTHPCMGALTCCSGVCVDTSRDPTNCGMCGHACQPHQFCTGTTCDDAVFLNVCANPSATVVLDPYPGDNDAGIAVGASLASSCGETVKQAPQDDGGVIDLDSGRPILGPGDTLVVGGGGFGQRAWAFLDSASLTAVYVGADSTNMWIENRNTMSPIVTTPTANLTDHHDYFFLELVVEPTSGTLCFGAVGMLVAGTGAAAYWASSQIIPNRASYPDAWYVYEWTDTNNDGIPDMGDTFTLLDHGI